MATANAGISVVPQVDAVEYPYTQERIHGNDVPFEEYIYRAAVQRRAEQSGLDLSGSAKANHTNSHSSSEKHDYEAAAAPLDKTWFNQLSEKKGPNVNLEQRIPEALPVDDFANLTPDEMERVNASRALRRATWAAVFYLITTVSVGGVFICALLRHTVY